MNQSEYARHHNVSRKTVTMWKERGWLVFDGDDINVAKSDARLATYRKSVRREKKVVVTPEPGKEPPASVDETPEEMVERMLIQRNAEMSLDEARRVKENYLALLTQLEYQKREGELVEMSVAKDVLFRIFRSQRDSWLNWPARVAPLMAADLDVPADKMTEKLNEYVHEHLAKLGAEPDPNRFITDEE